MGGERAVERREEGGRRSREGRGEERKGSRFRNTYSNICACTSMHEMSRYMLYTVYMTSTCI